MTVQSANLDGPVSMQSQELLIYAALEGIIYVEEVINFQTPCTESKDMAVPLNYSTEGR